MDKPSAVVPEELKVRRLPWSVASEGFSTIFSTVAFTSSVFVLFMNELGVSKAHLGALLSLFPFCGLIAPLLTPWIRAFGLKRTFLTFYGVRNIIILGLAASPWMLAALGPASMLAMVTATVLAFALCRAVAETAYYPWSQEFVPNRIRGRYSAWINMVSTVCGAMALVVCSLVIRHGSGSQRFAVLVAASAVAGIISVLLMAPIPGGLASPRRGSPALHLARTLRPLGDRNFRRYLLGAGCLTLSAAPVAFLPLFFRDVIGIAPNWIVLLDGAVMAGGFFSSYLWGRAADRHGSRPVLLLGLAWQTVLPVGWILLPRHSDWSAPLAAILALAWGIVATAAGIGAGRLLMNEVVPARRGTEYLALRYAWAGLVGGGGALAVGVVLEGLKSVGQRLPFDIYLPLWAACSILLVSAVMLFRKVSFEKPS